MNYEKLKRLKLEDDRVIIILYKKLNYSFDIKYRTCIAWYKNFHGNKDIDFIVR